MQDIFLFYLVAFLPTVLGLVLYLKTKRIILWEWIAASALAFVVAGIIHFCAIKGQTDDVETWSGQIVQAKKYSEWREYYEEAIYRTEYYYVTRTVHTGTGKNRSSRTVRERRSRRVFDHWEPRTRTHSERFDMASNIDTSYGISKQEFFRISDNLFSNIVSVAGTRRTGEHNSRMISGDPNDYVSKPVNGYIYPVTSLHHFENRIKAAPSVFSFAPVPSNAPIFNWPQNPNYQLSERVIGASKKYINTYLWDQMCAVLGPLKEVNPIIVGLGSNSIAVAMQQEAKWIGGKKNDIVLCWGGESNRAEWAYVFSWCKDALVKKNLESILLKNPIDNSILPLIDAEIRANFKRRDWESDFAYIQIPIPSSYFYWFLAILVLTQGGLWWFNLSNDFNKERK